MPGCGARRQRRRASADGTERQIDKARVPINCETREEGHNARRRPGRFVRRGTGHGTGRRTGAREQIRGGAGRELCVPQVRENSAAPARGPVPSDNVSGLRDSHDPADLIAGAPESYRPNRRLALRHPKERAWGSPSPAGRAVSGRLFWSPTSPPLIYSSRRSADVFYADAEISSTLSPRTFPGPHQMYFGPHPQPQTTPEREEQAVKIAAITDDGKTISQHFGRARHYLVFTVEDGRILQQELRDKAGHHTFALQGGDDHHSSGPHGFDPLAGTDTARCWPSSRIARRSWRAAWEWGCSETSRRWASARS